jgi:hypothetical protein
MNLKHLRQLQPYLWTLPRTPGEERPEVLLYGGAPLLGRNPGSPGESHFSGRNSVSRVNDIKNFFKGVTCINVSWFQ